MGHFVVWHDHLYAAGINEDGGIFIKRFMLDVDDDCVWNEKGWIEIITGFMGIQELRDKQLTKGAVRWIEGADEGNIEVSALRIESNSVDTYVSEGDISFTSKTRGDGRYIKTGKFFLPDTGELYPVVEARLKLLMLAAGTVGAGTETPWFELLGMFLQADNWPNMDGAG